MKLNFSIYTQFFCISVSIYFNFEPSSASYYILEFIALRFHGGLESRRDSRYSSEQLARMTHAGARSFHSIVSTVWGSFNWPSAPASIKGFPVRFASCSDCLMHQQRVGSVRRWHRADIRSISYFHLKTRSKISKPHRNRSTIFAVRKNLLLFRQHICVFAFCVGRGPSLASRKHQNKKQLI